MKYNKNNAHQKLTFERRICVVVVCLFEYVQVIIL